MRRVPWFILCFALLVVGLPAFAQASAPIYVVVQGELMRATPDLTALEPVTACTLPAGESVLGAPVPSPDGALLALRIEPLLVSETRARVGGWAGGENPSDLVICDPAAGPIARFSQPADAALLDSSGKPDTFTLRSAPAWSTDGRALAWTECDASCANPRVMTDTLEAGTPQTLAALPPQYGVPASVPIAWGGPLILVHSVTLDPATSQEDARLLGFDPATGAQTLNVSTTPPRGSDFSFVTDFFWADVQTMPRIVMLRSSGAWIAVDPGTGTASLLEGAPERVSPLAPDGISAVADGRAAQALNLRWLAREGDTLTPLGDDVRGFTPPSIAPDGRALVYYDNLTPTIWQAGAVTALPLPPLSPIDPAYAAWGPAVWRIFTGPLPDASGAFVCFGAPDPRLQIGGMAHVVEGRGANNVRNAPATTGELLGMVAEGSVVQVIGGPVCADGYAWWQIASGDLTGWTAEGEGLDYWLEPADG